MKIVRLVTTALVRFFLSLAFLTDAANKIIYWHDAERIWSDMLADWQTYTWFWERGSTLFAWLAQWVPLWLILSTLCELVGALLLLLALKEKLGAFLLFFYLALTTLLFHPFWCFEGGVRELQGELFLKNLAMLGGLLLVLLHGITREEPHSSFD